MRHGYNRGQSPQQVYLLIEVENLSKYYGDFIAIENVSFELKKGEIVAFLGPNAAGKTTTLRCITGFLPPSAGTVRIDGYDISTHSIEARRQIGYLPENVPLYTDMTVRDYLDFQGQLRKMPAKERKVRIDFVVERLHLQFYTDTFIGRLSKGFRQRVGLAQAILHDPQVLVLDEPTASIDPVQVVETRDLVKSLGRDHTVLFSTHILSEAGAVSQRVVVINEGHIVAEDKPDNLAIRLRGSEQVQMEVRGPGRDVAAKLREVEGVTKVTRQEAPGGINVFTLECRPGTNVKEELAALVIRSNWGLLSLQSVKMSLEDIFLRLTAPKEEAVS